jgi:Rrf2 family protein
LTLASADIYPAGARSHPPMAPVAHSTPTRRSSLMNVGRRMDYAVRALCYLAAQSERRMVPRNEIQERQRIPPHFLAKILRKLVTAGYLGSVPGARGGFQLLVPADRITMRNVYECIEGPLCLMECVEEEADYCRFAPVCTQIGVWRGAQAALGRYLETVCVSDIADSHGLVRRLEELHQRNEPAACRQAQE